MKKQAELIFSSKSAELNVFHALLNKAKQDKNLGLVLIHSNENSTHFVERLKKRFA